MKIIDDPAVKKVFKAVNNQVRLVGGCVRDSVLHVPIKDIDMATPLTPEQVMEMLTVAGIKVIPTGLKHGTVTAVIDRRHIEITTLREDVKTDGRHAVVRWTDEYARDATRRDFTMNALYMDMRGQIYDTVGGMKDLKARRVRFIGCAQERIREDYLRILRYFRFWALVDTHPADHNVLKACAELSDGLKQVSNERKTVEFLKILMTPRAVEAIQLMQRAGVMKYILPRVFVSKLNTLLTVYPKAGVIERLSILTNGKTGVLVLSNVQKKELNQMSRQVQIGRSVRDDKIYYSNVPAAIFKFHIYRALAAKKMTKYVAKSRLKMKQPVFKVTGADLVRAGFRPGPEIGLVLDEARKRWAKMGFPVKKTLVIEQVMAYNRRKVKRSGA